MRFQDPVDLTAESSRTIFSNHNLSITSEKCLMEGHSASNDGLFLLFKEVTMEAAKAVSIEPQHRVVLPEFAWQDIPEAGAYVERGTGDLFRIPKEALVPGSSPIVHKESMGASRFVQLSKNPYITTLAARMLCAEHNIEPNF